MSVDRANEIGVQEDKLRTLTGASVFNATFLKKCEVVKEQLKCFKADLKTLQSKYGETIKAPSAKRSKEAVQDVDNLLDACNGYVSVTRAALTEMATGINEAKSKPVEKEAQNNIHEMLTIKFQDLLNQMTDIQGAYKGKKEGQLKSQIKTVNPNASNREVDDMINSGSELIFAEALTSSAEHRAKDVLLDVKERYREIKKIETNITEMKSIFVEMATLVNNQRSMMIEIDYKVSASLKYTEEGVDDLKKAKELQSAAQKKRMIMIVLIVVFVLVVVLAVVVG